MNWNSIPDSLFWTRLARVKRGWRATLLGPPLGRLTIQAGSLLAVFLAGVWMERGFGQGRDSWLPCTSLTATSPSEQDAPPLDDGVGTASPTTQSLATLRLEMSATRERIEALKEERKENQVVMHLMALEDEPRPLKRWPYRKGRTVRLFVLAGHRNMEGERAFVQGLRIGGNSEDDGPPSTGPQNKAPVETKAETGTGGDEKRKRTAQR